MSKLTKLAAKMTLGKDLGPERDYNERGRVRKAFAVFGSKLKNMLAINLMLDVFALPLIIMFVFLMGRYEQNQIAEAGYSFSGFLGIGYGLVDDTVAGINMIYGIRSDFFLYFFTPSTAAVFAVRSSQRSRCANSGFCGSVRSKRSILLIFKRRLSADSPRICPPCVLSPLR